MKVAIVDYDERWPRMFEEEKALLSPALENAEAEIEHIGSTSVAGLAAKPVIDLMIGLKDFSLADALVPLIVALGYDYIKEFEDEMPYRRYCTRRPRGEDTHHIHLVAIGGEFWTRLLQFRNYLRLNAKARDEYARLKNGLAKLEWKDVDEYADAKSEFIRRAEKEAHELFSTG